MADLTKRQEHIVREVRTNVSAVVAGWIQAKFQAGMTPETVMSMLDKMREPFDDKIEDEYDQVAIETAATEGMGAQHHE